MSYDQLNCVAAVLLLPEASVNTPPGTSIVVVPEPDGVKVAVYSVDEVAAKSLNAPPETVMSLTTKSLVASLAVNVRERVV